MDLVGCYFILLLVVISCFDLLLAITVVIIVLPHLVVVVTELGVVAITLLMGLVITELAVIVVGQILLAIRIAQMLLIVTRVNPVHLQNLCQISSLLLVLHFYHRQSMLQLPYALEILVKLVCLLLPFPLERL